MTGIALLTLSDDHKQMVDTKKSPARVTEVSGPEKRFYEFLELCDGMSMSDFAREMGYTPARVSNWFRRDPPQIPHKPEVLRGMLALARRYRVGGLTLEWLNLNEGPTPFKLGRGSADVVDLDSSDVPPSRLGPPGTVRIHFLKGFSAERARFIDIPSSLLRDDPEILSPTVRALINPSDAMRGEIEKGDLVLVDTAVHSVSAEGIYAYKLGKIPFVKRIQIRGTGVLRLQGTKPHEDSFDLSGAELDQLEIGGRVVGTLSCKKF